ncbi:glycosyltransferase family 2 protein [Odoribacter sp. AF15-53]|uniref:glycosyltransferase family 2 protein n=1 Tax=Odoribacter sp. AF15-53 TaxID=2292236 RepID=UPI000E4680AB|nr:glycosyltransferase family 2 protein [Odoribacter sp. AF15-53]RHR82448.1 glycosyltransferase family 2 protein [Odoribacter sp. AF15-53]
MKIGCVLVMYNPRQELLTTSLNSLNGQVDEIFLGDNSVNTPDFMATLLALYPHVYYHGFNENLGIAEAQNRGITYFQEKGFDFVLFMDQDSLAPENLVSSLLADYNRLREAGIAVGGIGPRPFNRGEGKPYVGAVKKGKLILPKITEVGEIISSASLVPMVHFKQVGGMESSLFIDGVDHEWCWRARKIGGWRFFISESVQLSHQVGEGDRPFIIRKVAIPTPFRTYYQFRNYFRLVHRGYVPFYWKISNGFKYSIKFFYYPLCVSPRISYIKQILKGIYAGITGK